MNLRTSILAAALLAAGASGAAAAGVHVNDDDDGGVRPINEHRPLNPNAKVTVSNVAGSITVDAWGKNELALGGQLSDEVEELKITGTPADLRIEVKLPKDTRHCGNTRLNLQVPAGVTLKVEAVSADVSVDGLSGPVTASSVSGDVSVQTKSQKVSGDSVSGDVRISAPATHTHAQTVSGDVKVSGASGKVEAESVSGDVFVDAVDVRSMTVKTVSGEMQLALTLAGDGDLQAQSLSGGIYVTLPASTAAEVELQSFSGDVSSAFGKLAGEEGQKRSQTIGAGKAKVSLSTFSGEVELKKKK